MATQVKNIIVGAARIWLSANSTQDGTAAQSTLPTPTTSYATALDAAPASWTDVGFTTDGFQLSYEPDYGEVTVDQLLDAARLFKQAMKVNLKTTLVEATLANLYIVFDQQAGLTGTSPTQQLEVLGGSLGDTPVERSLAAVGPGVRPASGNAERAYLAYRVLSIESTQHGLMRNDATVFPVTFRVLPLASTSNAYGKIIDRTY